MRRSLAAGTALRQSNFRLIFGSGRIPQTITGKSVSMKPPARAPRGTRYDAFLRRLRAGGRSNMYGAIPYLMAKFELDRETAFRVVCDWVDQHADLVEPEPRLAVRARSA